MDLFVLIIAIGLSVAAFGQGNHADFPPPLVRPPSSAADLHDPVTELARRMEQGKTTLEFHPDFGFLPAILRELRIPVSSQMLVFSKTSLQHKFINPQTPRAIFFNDSVYAGFVPDGSLMELSAVDPQRGAVFYTIDQMKGSRPRMVKNEDCVQCHSTPATLGIPGHMVRSVFTRTDGTASMRAPSYLSDHRSPIEERWGGWFVSGKLEGDLHMGNAFLREADDPAAYDRKPGSQMKDISTRFHSERYLTPDSDVVALMVLEHQVRLHNLIARLHYDASQELPLDAEIEELLRYLLFVDEAPLKGAVAGSTKFAAEFEHRGPKDSKGRSLRQFDLKTRMFRYPCSYLIYSDTFAALPKRVKQTLYKRLADILAGREGSAVYAKLKPADRKVIAEILRDTNVEFATAWRR